MGILRLPAILKQAAVKVAPIRDTSGAVPKGHVAVYVVGEEKMMQMKKRFVVPISVLTHPSFLALLDRAKEEFGYNHPTGGLTIPCSEQLFLRLTSGILNGL